MPTPYRLTATHSSGGIRVDVDLDTVTPKLRKQLAALTATADAVNDAREAERTCGHGTGPQRREYENAVTAAEKKLRTVWETTVETAAAEAPAWAEHAVRGYAAARARYEQHRQAAAAAAREAQAYARSHVLAVDEPFKLNTHGHSNDESRQAAYLASVMDNASHGLPVFGAGRKAAA
ncbi:hypothetical protein [Streptomyces sp. NPDC006784]|uniref:hypothetical protein n=1 Tax=Streptomyces sp. NPDC006784 TaxID=3364764 RepID=UPI0036B458F3